MRRHSAILALGLLLLICLLHARIVQASSPLIGLLFHEVNEIAVSPDGQRVAIKGRAWMWNHHITFPISDASGRQCLKNFAEQQKNRGRELQFGGYYTWQSVDQNARTTTTDFGVITECYFR